MNLIINAFSNLYKTTLKKNVKFYYETIEEDALFYIDIFYRKNKYLFKENFINFFYKELNIYNIRIFAMKENFEELILDYDFNKTLKNVSNELFKEYLINKLNSTFKNAYNNKISEIYSLLEKYDKKIIEILSGINKNEDNLKINIIIMNYQEILLAQSNKFLFRVSKEPCNYLKDFITIILEPPLIKIKEQYDLIEKLIFDTISDSIDNFPDCTGVLKDMLGVEKIFNYINELYYIIKDLLINYGNELDINTN